MEMNEEDAENSVAVTAIEGEEEEEEEKHPTMSDDGLEQEHEEQEQDQEQDPDADSEGSQLVTAVGSGSLAGHEHGEYSVSVPSTNVKIVKVVPLPHARSEVWSYFGFIADDDGEIQDKKKAICKICASTLAYSGNTTNLFTHLKAMHPEVNPQKLAPTNRTPRTGKKNLGKRKFFEVSDAGSGHLGNAITISSGQSQSQNQYIIRAVAFNNNETSLFDTSPSANTSGSISNGTHVLRSNSALKGASSSSQGTILNSDGLATVSSDDITDAIVNLLVRDCRPISITEGKGFDDLMNLVAPGYKVPDSKRLKVLVKKRYEDFRRDLILRGMDDE